MSSELRRRLGRLLRLHERYTWTRKRTFLAGVADYLRQHNQATLAAMSFALAGWSFGRGESWFVGFDNQHVGYLTTGRQLDAEVFDRTIAERVAANIKEVEGYTVGSSVPTDPYRCTSA